MKTFATGNRVTSRGARRVFGLLAVAWLNLALQPCAMALGAEPAPACPHCPPAEAAAEAAHGGHAMHAAADADTAMPCATTASACLDVGESRVDGRAGQLKAKDAPGDQPLAILPAVGPPAQKARPARANAPKHCPHPGGSPPLNVLYCVYLK